jgi:hypothetical protein
LLSTGPAIRAMQVREEDEVRHAILNALAPFKTSSGGYHLSNSYRYMIASARRAS